MTNKIGLYISAALSVTSISAQAEMVGSDDRPNILWLTFEDTSWFELGCYGNKFVQTPNIDSLASNGFQFMNAWSVAPQSSPARSSLITGSYATTYAMDLHPRQFNTPDNIFFTKSLRDRGYYCTNNSKTHYNTTLDHSTIWDESSIEASYNSTNRNPNQPFFSVFNTVTSHMGRVRTFHLDGRRDYLTEGISPTLLDLPAHVPDTYEMRMDYAGHLEAIQDVDEWVGYFIKDLKVKGLFDDTIIFVFSDHGGCLPRGKGYLFETGLRIPLVVHVPEKWKHLAGEISNKEESLVSFLDLGPTVLSLAGIEPPGHMQGKPVMGDYKASEPKRIQFAFATNQLHHFMPVRAATDGKYKYIRTYVPYKQFALRNYYQWGMPSNQSWDRLVLDGTVNKVFKQPYEHQPVEMLFDLEHDVFEINNLAGNDEFKSVLRYFRNAVSANIRETRDLGFFIPTSRKEQNLHKVISANGYPINLLYEIVELVGTAKTKDIPKLITALKNNNEDIRYWSAVALSQMLVSGILHACPSELIDVLNDENSYVACEAAYGVSYSDTPEKGIERLLNPKKESDRKIGYSLLESLSLDSSKHGLIKQYKNHLINKAELLPALENEDAGLMARGILVNIGCMDLGNLYGDDSYKKGIKLNKGRRPKKPLP